MLVHLPGGHTADVVADALADVITSLPSQLRRSITWDQGKEVMEKARKNARRAADLHGQRIVGAVRLRHARMGDLFTCGATDRGAWPPLAGSRPACMGSFLSAQGRRDSAWRHEVFPSVRTAIGHIGPRHMTGSRWPAIAGAAVTGREEPFGPASSRSRPAESARKDGRLTRSVS
jgi:hypothetical protein